MNLRIARHSNNIKALETFYQEILNLEKLGAFESHDGYDGTFLGKTDQNWHFEFTQSTVLANHSFDEDDMLVFYPSTQEEYDRILYNIEVHKLPKITPINPYWKINGIMIEDPDGYKVVISPLKIKD